MTSKNNKTLKLIPLGGVNEIGKIYDTPGIWGRDHRYRCGLSFPEEEMLGIDLVIPDITYLQKNKEKVKAIIVTHGHEDHIGALPYVLKEINVPIYGTRLTLGLIENKLKEHSLDEVKTQMR